MNDFDLPWPVVFVLVTISFYAGFLLSDIIDRHGAKQWCVEKAETKEQVLKGNERKFPWEK
jgi:hypothetical protein